MRNVCKCRREPVSRAPISDARLISRSRPERRRFGGPLFRPSGAREDQLGWMR